MSQSAGRHLLLVVNPTAGHYTEQRLTNFVQQLEHIGCEVQVELTRRQGHSTEIVRSYLARNTPDIIIAGGGDGTIAEIAQAMMKAPCALALWPIGSANVLARELHIPFDDAENAALLARGTRRTVWPGQITTAEQTTPTLFLQMAGVGLDGWIVQNLSPMLKKHTGRVAYVIAALQLALSRPLPPFKTRVDGISHRTVLSIISKGRLYGGPFALFRHNLHHQPAFSVLLLHRLNPLLIIWQMIMMRLKRRPSSNPAFTILTGETIICDHTSPIPAQSDGDFRGVTPLRITSAPTLLKIIAPPQPVAPSTPSQRSTSGRNTKRR
ncbi:hypothetical protein BG621_04325 [Parasaccharibacter apium]|nr:hypothetical protein BG621_04325 [Parasaccharibacter apium]